MDSVTDHKPLGDPDGCLECAGSDASDFVVVVGKKDEERFRKFAIGEDKAIIENIEALPEVNRVWALRSKRTSDVIWSKIHSGNRVFFARYGMPFSHLGIVLGTLVDESVATRLWGDTPQVRQLDRLVLFSSVQKISKQFGKTCNLAGIRPTPFTSIYVAKNLILTFVKPDSRHLDMGPAGVMMLDGGTNGTVMLESGVAGPPKRVTEAVTRFLRDTEKVKQLKSKYQGKCQICGYVLRRLEGGMYSEVHHLRPLKDDGDDDFGNMLNLCANHHVEFDYLLIGVLEDCQTVVDIHGNRMGTLTFNRGHELTRKNILFHLKRMGMK